MPRLSTPTIVRFWLPLAGTWLMMAFEGPFLAAVIARLPDPTENLAAYGVAFAFAVIIESPIIMLLSASTALVRDRGSYAALSRFSYTLNVVLTAIIVVVIVPSVFGRVADLMRLPVEARELTRQSLAWLIPWPGFIGYRRFKQGLLISHNRTRLVAVGTVLRLATMGTTALAVARWTLLPGAEVGAVALSCGVVLEAVASGWMARRIVRRLPDRHEETEAQPLTLSRIVAFYLPLAASAMMAMAVQPMVTFFMGTSRFALESLAVLPVINGLTFIFRSLGVSYQEAGIALTGRNGEHYPELRRFATGLGITTSICLALIAFTPLSSLWFGRISGLSPELTAFALLPTRILAALPGLSVLLSFQRSLLLNARRTTWITWATLIEVTAIAAIILGAIAVLDLPGAVAAAIGLILGRVLSNAFLLRPCWGVVRGYRSSHTEEP
jgi:Na+-driven multidrug efflux pump